jgi:phage shock protein PspC (stress-responsive transcriptional regulator)
MEQQKGLYRSKSDVVIGGVAAGLAKSIGADTALVRLAFVLLAVFGGTGFLIYIILWIALPEEREYYEGSSNLKSAYMESENVSPGNDPKNVPPKQKNDGNLIAGLILISLGAIFLLERWVHWIDFADLWPLILVVVGIILIRRSFLKS